MNFYHHIYYKLYKVSGVYFTNSLKKESAFVFILILELITILSFVNYYIYKTKHIIDFDMIELLVISIILSLINYNVFFSKSQWKMIVQEHEKLTDKKNRLGTLCVCSLIIILLANFIFSYYLLSLIDWSLYIK